MAVEPKPILLNNIHSLCPTRCVVRTRCLMSVEINWETLNLLFAVISGDKITSKENREKANTILKKVEIVQNHNRNTSGFSPCEN